MASLLAGTPLAVVAVPGAGRGCVVTRDVAAGELLLSALPYGVALDAEWLDSICLGCAKQARQPYSLRCEECKSAYFCSARCRDGAGLQRHRPVCGWEAPCLAALREADAASPTPLRPEPYEETTVRLVLAVLMTHAEAEGVLPGSCAAERVTERGAPTYRDVMSQAASDAALPPRTAALAALAHAAFAKVLPEGVTPSPEEVLGLFARDECNGFGYWSSSYERQGVGCAPGAALFNHSCTPNAAKVQSHAFRVEVRALRPLAAREEVRFSYVPLRDAVTERRAVLARHFGFHCACERCAVETEAGGAVLAPPAAHACGGVLYPCVSDGVLRQRVLRCSICRKELPLSRAAAAAAAAAAALSGPCVKAPEAPRRSVAFPGEDVSDDVASEEEVDSDYDYSSVYSESVAASLAAPSAAAAQLALSEDAAPEAQPPPPPPPPPQPVRVAAFDADAASEVSAAHFARNISWQRPTSSLTPPSASHSAALAAAANAAAAAAPPLRGVAGLRQRMAGVFRRPAATAAPPRAQQQQQQTDYSDDDDASSVYGTSFTAADSGVAVDDAAVAALAAEAAEEAEAARWAAAQQAAQQYKEGLLGAPSDVSAAAAPAPRYASVGVQA